MKLVVMLFAMCLALAGCGRKSIAGEYTALSMLPAANATLTRDGKISLTWGEGSGSTTISGTYKFYNERLQLKFTDVTVQDLPPELATEFGQNLEWPLGTPIFGNVSYGDGGTILWSPTGYSAISFVPRK